MSGVLALALKRMALSHGTVPSAVPVGQAIASGTDGTVGTNGTLGTLSDASLDGGSVDPAAIKERAALAAVSVPPGCLDAWTQFESHRPLSVTGFALLHRARDGWSGVDWRAFFDELAAIAEFDGGAPDRPRQSPRFLRWVSRHEEITMSTKQTAPF
jgi:hypothetical protein